MILTVPFTAWGLTLISCPHLDMPLGFPWLQQQNIDTLKRTDLTFVGRLPCRPAEVCSKSSRQFTSARRARCAGDWHELGASQQPGNLHSWYHVNVRLNINERSTILRTSRDAALRTNDHDRAPCLLQSLEPIILDQKDVCPPRNTS